VYTSHETASSQRGKNLYQPLATQIYNLVLNENPYFPLVHLQNPELKQKRCTAPGCRKVHVTVQ
jgi:hypothetical protein